LSEDEYKNLPSDELNLRIEHNLTQWLRAQAQLLDPKLPAILAAHISVWGAEVGSEKGMLIGQEHALLRSSIALPQFDYVALGHIHRHQLLGERPPIVYPGSLGTIDFSDEGQERGFYVVELQGKRVLSCDFHPVKTRRFLTIDVNADAENPMLSALEELSRHNTRDAIVRVRLRLPASAEGQIEEAELHKALKDAHFVIITKEIEREHRLRLSQHPVEGITPVEALKVYLESKGTPPERAKELLEYGKRLIQGHNGMRS
jgi:exonuclease SbcD